MTVGVRGAQEGKPGDLHGPEKTSAKNKGNSGIPLQSLGVAKQTGVALAPVPEPSFHGHPVFSWQDVKKAFKERSDARAQVLEVALQVVLQALEGKNPYPHRRLAVLRKGLRVVRKAAPLHIPA